MDNNFSQVTVIKMIRPRSPRTWLYILAICLIFYVCRFTRMRPLVFLRNDWNKYEDSSGLLSRTNSEESRRHPLHYLQHKMETRSPSILRHVASFSKAGPEEQHGTFITSLPSLSSSTSQMNVKEPQEEEDVPGNSPHDWCIGLRSLYPSILNQSQIRHLHRISGHERIINPNSVRLIYNPERLCEVSSKIYVLSIVKSQAENAKLRQAIRGTWGKEASSGNNRLAFLLGFSSDLKIQRLVQRENSAYGDIIQGDFIENYYNNTLKTMMGIHWISTFCPKTRFVFFVDDDVLVNYKNLQAYYEKLPRTKERQLFSGNLKLEWPVRDKGDRYYMPISVYPYNCYPAYISGAVTLTTGRVVRKIHTLMPFVRRFKYDDVFIAIIIQKLGIWPQRNYRVSIPKKEAHEMIRMIASHGFKNATEYMRTHKIMTKMALDKTQKNKGVMDNKRYSLSKVN